MVIAKENMKPKSESFKMEQGLMKMVRKAAKQDRRTIKAVIEIALREQFKLKEKI